jgi:hypothetical protein
MDSIFEEGAEEVGGEIEAYCPSPRCKADTTHTIISMYEDDVRRVQCVVCGEVHAYRKPRGDSTEEGADGAAKRLATKRLTWDDALARTSDADLANCRPYSVRDAYEEGDVVQHPRYDIGFVTELLPDNKFEVIFRDGEPRILVHKRIDLAAKMPDISEIPVPREAKKKKRAKKEVPSAPVPARSKAQVEEAVARARAAAQARSDEAQRTADERNKALRAEAKSKKGKLAAKKAAKSAAKTTVKPAAKPAAKAAAKPAAKKPAAKKPAAKKPAAKKPAAKKPAAKKPAKKPPAKKPSAKKPAKKPGKKK